MFEIPLDSVSFSNLVWDLILINLVEQTFHIR